LFAQNTKDLSMVGSSGKILQAVGYQARAEELADTPDFKLGNFGI
jgi:hypothetical protein